MTKMTKAELLSFYRAMNTLGNATGAKFSYAVTRNLNALKGEVDAIQSALNPTEKFTEYDNKRVALAKEHSKKDEQGKPLIEGNQYVVEDTFDVAFEALKEEYKEEIDARQKQIEDYQALLDEEIEVDIFVLSQENLPDTISVAQVNALFPMIKE